ncbi:MAG: type VII toxin-antitoxin system MntA family adenylyltransferase antitoxin [Actinomycetota bacterium]
MTGTAEELEEIFRKAGVLVAYLFGSRARGRHRETSDADVAVLLDGERGLLEQEALADQLARAMGLPDVDLIVLDEAPLEMRGRVVQEGRVLFSADEARRVAFEVLTRSQYFDFLPILEAHTRRYLRQVAREGLRG